MVTKAMQWANAQLPNYENEEALVPRLFSFMRPGEVADWAQPHLEWIINNQRDAITTRREFLRTFVDTFEDPDTERLAARQIEALKQEGSIHDYTTTFKNLRSDLKWNEPALISQYEQGLQHRIKAQIAVMENKLETLAAYQKAANKLGNVFAKLDAS